MKGRSAAADRVTDKWWPRHLERTAGLWEPGSSWRRAAQARS